MVFNLVNNNLLAYVLLATPVVILTLLALAIEPSTPLDEFLWPDHLTDGIDVQGRVAPPITMPSSADHHRSPCAVVLIVKNSNDLPIQAASSR